ncbi:hypothetical protein [Microcoleus sp. B3-D7]|uniref:hypothetical protein n=1 Tax=Microcoleus sp. B3-D7 TaxID=2818659 RepID=UPI002FD36462
MNWKKYAVVCGLLLLTTGCTTEKRERFISEKELGKDWPFIVPSGTLVCIVTPVENRSIFFISPDGKKYDLMSAEEYPSFYSILRPAPQNPSYFVNPGWLLKKAMKVCPEPFYLAPL